MEILVKSGSLFCPQNGWFQRLMNSSGNNAWYTRLDDDCDDHYVSITNAILVLERCAVEVSDLTITAIKPYHYEWSEEYDIAKGSPWFNLENYVEVTVENNRNATAESFEVTLYADDKPIGSKPVEGGATPVFLS